MGRHEVFSVLTERRPMSQTSLPLGDEPSRPPPPPRPSAGGPPVPDRRGGQGSRGGTVAFSAERGRGRRATSHRAGIEPADDPVITRNSSLGHGHRVMLHGEWSRPSLNATDPAMEGAHYGGVAAGAVAEPEAQRQLLEPDNDARGGVLEPVSQAAQRQDRRRAQHRQPVGLHVGAAGVEAVAVAVPRHDRQGVVGGDPGGGGRRVDGRVGSVVVLIPRPPCGLVFNMRSVTCQVQTVLTLTCQRPVRLVSPSSAGPTGVADARGTARPRRRWQAGRQRAADQPHLNGPLPEGAASLWRSCMRSRRRRPLLATCWGGRWEVARGA